MHVWMPRLTCASVVHILHQQPARLCLLPPSPSTRVCARQLAEREKNKHLLFKSFSFVNEFQVSNTGGRVSSVTFRDELLVVSTDFDGNCKFTIWKSSVLVCKGGGGASFGGWCRMPRRPESGSQQQQLIADS
jgi:hypothetical protein